MKLLGSSMVLSLAAIVTIEAATAAAPVDTVDPIEVSRSVGICARATSKRGVDDKLFQADGWSPMAVDGLPGDRFYSKGRLRASLGTRSGVGGSCIVSFNVRTPYDLAPLTTTLEKTLHAGVMACGADFALLMIPEKVVQALVQPIPNGSLVSVSVEMGR